MFPMKTDMFTDGLILEFYIFYVSVEKSDIQTIS